jgi:SOS response regulatory protein OraA/RecX
MSFSLNKSSIDPAVYEILEEGQIVKEISVSFTIYRWPSEFLSIEEVELWVINEEKRLAKRAAYRLTAAKHQSAFELSQKLHRKGFSLAIIEELIEEFKHFGYLSDEGLSTSIIEKEIRKGYGPRHIEMKLRSLGLQTDEVRKLATEQVQREAIAKLRGKSAAALQRRGFDTRIIFSCLNERKK